MGNRYRRIVTLGMISFTALLAWGYCMLVYRSEMLYIAVISLILVGSMYALALAVVEMKDKKESDMRQYAEGLLKESVSNQDYTEALDTLERLAKASYVQQRKTATCLGQQNETVTDVVQMLTTEQSQALEKLQTQIDESLTKAVKILVKYNQNDNEKQMESTKALTDGMSQELSELTMTVAQITSVLQDMTEEISRLKETVQTVPQTVYVPTPAAVTENPASEASVTVSENPVSETAAIEADVVSEAPAAESEEEEKIDMEALFASLEKATEPLADTTVLTEAEIEQTEMVVPEEEQIELKTEPQTEPQATEAVETAFNSEDFFARFGGTEDTALKEEAAFKEEALGQTLPNDGGMLDQSMIDALLSQIPMPEIKEEALADVIPFPQTQDGNQPDANDGAQNGTPIGVDGANQAEPAQDVTEAAVTEEQPAAVAPVVDDPNRPLTPEEIAALFASMQ